MPFQNNTVYSPCEQARIRTDLQAPSEILEREHSRLFDHPDTADYDLGVCEAASLRRFESFESEREISLDGLRMDVSLMDRSAVKKMGIVSSRVPIEGVIRVDGIYLVSDRARATEHYIQVPKSLSRVGVSVEINSDEALNLPSLVRRLGHAMESASLVHIYYGGLNIFCDCIKTRRWKMNIFSAIVRIMHPRDPVGLGIVPLLQAEGIDIHAYRKTSMIEHFRAATQRMLRNLRAGDGLVELPPFRPIVRTEMESSSRSSDVSNEIRRAVLADYQQLAGNSDGLRIDQSLKSLYVERFSPCPKDAVHLGLWLLQYFGAPVIGAVITKGMENAFEWNVWVLGALGRQHLIDQRRGFCYEFDEFKRKKEVRVEMCTHPICADISGLSLSDMQNEWDPRYLRIGEAPDVDVWPLLDFFTKKHDGIRALENVWMWRNDLLDMYDKSLHKMCPMTASLLRSAMLDLEICENLTDITSYSVEGVPIQYRLLPESFINASIEERAGVHYKAYALGQVIDDAWYPDELKPEMETIQGDGPEDQAVAADVETAAPPLEVVTIPSMCGPVVSGNPVDSNEMIVKSFTWMTGSSALIEPIKVFSDIIKSCRKLPALANMFVHRYLRADIEFDFITNTNAFQAGLMIASFIPMTSEIAKGSLEKYTSISCASGRPHARIEAGVTGRSTLVVPFQHVMGFLPVIQQQESGVTMADLGLLFFNVVSPLTSMSTSISKPTITVVVRLVNVQYMGPIPRFKPEMFGILRNVGKAIDVLTSNDRERDNPENVRPPVPVFSYTNVSLGVGDDQEFPSSTFRLRPETQPTLSYAQTETDLGKLMQIPAIVDRFDWTESASNEALIYEKPLSPFIPWNATNDVNNTIVANLAPVGFIASAFAFYRGSLVVTLDFISTKYQVGALLVCYAPNDGSDVTFGNARAYPHVIVSVEGRHRVAIKLPYMHDRPWFKNRVVAFAREIKTEAHGRIVIFVLNRLVPMEDVQNKIQVIVSLSAADDFEVACPVESPLALSFDTKRQDSAQSSSKHLDLYVGVWHKTGKNQVVRCGTTSDQVETFDPIVKGDEVLRVPKRVLVDGAMLDYRMQMHSPGLVDVEYLAAPLDYPTVMLAFDTISSVRHFLAHKRDWKEGIITDAGGSPWHEVFKDGSWRAFSGIVHYPVVHANDGLLTEAEEGLTSLSMYPNLPSTGAGGYFFGESFTNLKQMTRRFGFLDRVTIEPSDVSSERIPLAIPLCPQGMKVHGGASDPLSLSRESNVQLFLSGYRMYAGGMRLILKCSRSVGVVTLEYFPQVHLRSRSFHTSYSGDSFEPNAGNPTVIHDLSQGSIIRLTIPNYNPAGLVCTQDPNFETVFGAESSSLGTLGVWYDGDGPLGITIYHATSDDGIPLVFVNFPSVWSKAEMALGLSDFAVLEHEYNVDVFQVISAVAISYAIYKIYHLIEAGTRRVTHTLDHFDRQMQRIDEVVRVVNTPVRQERATIEPVRTFTKAISLRLSEIFGSPIHKWAEMMAWLFGKASQVFCAVHGAGLVTDAIVILKKMTADFFSPSFRAESSFAGDCVSNLINMFGGYLNPEFTTAIVNKCARVVTSLKTIGSTIGFCMTSIFSMIALCLAKAFGGPTLIVKGVEKDALDHWFRECLSMNVAGAAVIGRSRDLIARLYYLCLFGTKIEYLLLTATERWAEKTVTQSLMNVQRILRQLEKIRSDPAILANAPATIEPYVVYCHGPTNIGKSHLCENLANLLVEWSPLKPIGPGVYTHPPGAKHFQDNGGEVVAQFDDFDQIKADGSTMSDCALLMAIKTAAVFVPPRAQLAEKKRPANFSAIVCASNTEMLADATVRDYDALNRRRDFLFAVRLSENYTHVSKVPDDVLEKFEHLEFSVSRDPVKPASSEADRQWINIYGLRTLLKERHREYMKKAIDQYSSRLALIKKTTGTPADRIFWRIGNYLSGHGEEALFEDERLRRTLRMEGEKCVHEQILDREREVIYEELHYYVLDKTGLKVRVSGPCDRCPESLKGDGCLKAEILSSWLRSSMTDVTWDDGIPVFLEQTSIPPELDEFVRRVKERPHDEMLLKLGLKIQKGSLLAIILKVVIGILASVAAWGFSITAFSYGKKLLCSDNPSKDVVEHAIEDPVGFMLSESGTIDGDRPRPPPKKKLGQRMRRRNAQRARFLDSDSNDKRTTFLNVDGTGRVGYDFESENDLFMRVREFRDGSPSEYCLDPELVSYLKSGKAFGLHFKSTDTVFHVSYCGGCEDCDAMADEKGQLSRTFRVESLEGIDEETSADLDVVEAPAITKDEHRITLARNKVWVLVKRNTFQLVRGHRKIFGIGIAGNMAVVPAHIFDCDYVQKTIEPCEVTLISTSNLVVGSKTFSFVVTDARFYNEGLVLFSLPAKAMSFRSLKRHLISSDPVTDHYLSVIIARDESAFEVIVQDLPTSLVRRVGSQPVGFSAPGLITEDGSYSYPLSQAGYCGATLWSYNNSEGKFYLVGMHTSGNGSDGICEPIYADILQTSPV